MKLCLPKKILFFILFYSIFIGAFAQDTSIHFNDLFYVDQILKKYKVGTVDKLPIEGLKEVSDEYFRIKYIKENLDLIKKILSHPYFKKEENYGFEKVFLQSQICLLENNTDTAKILNDSLIKLDAKGYYAGKGALGNMYIESVQKDSIELHKYYLIAERVFLNKKNYFELGIVYYQMGRLYANSNIEYAIELFTKGISSFNKADKTDIKVMDYLPYCSS